MHAVGRGSIGLWIADIAANFVVVVVIVIALAARFGVPTDPEPRTLTIHRIASVGGAGGVALLRQRLLQGADGEIVDVTAAGPLSAGDVAPEAWLVLAPAGVPDGLPLDAVVFHVPDALRDVAGDWSRDFLALAPIADDAARFRAALADLLARGGGDASLARDPAADAAAPDTLAARIAVWSARARDTAGLVALAVVAAFMAVVRWRFLRA